MHTLLAAATDTTPTFGPGLFIGYLVGYVIGALPLFGIFNKAGEAGWQAFVPIWNAIVLLKITGKPAWWIVLYLIPIVNIVITVIVLHALSTSFGHGAGFTAGLFFLSLIFLYILWLDGSTYRGAGAQAQPAGAYA
ncbi:hypothetical protein Cch01nite_19580 [Cellulomonas chitinilytica]|uniref:Signal peptidase I n=1 Tax=Cellulomonas chitinilytica TaxID=398759 RepID=A0A919U2L6_9CELL|nr:DUF5684 domain-containing protein [Cellulomonas chitinilytica]GIG21234.1 hypothetical protein Cch01nite_19580 [Cellulomonas chitinilytica]